jgi:spoIIIJ-associated protein
MERRNIMDQDYIEITEKTVEDAITAACQRLSVTSDRLDYTVVSEGSSGFLGFNAKNAVIKARVKDISERTEAVLNDVLNKADQKIKDDAEAAKAAEKKAAAEAEAKAQAEAAAKAEAEKKSAEEDAAAYAAAQAAVSGTDHTGRSDERETDRRDSGTRDRSDRRQGGESTSHITAAPEKKDPLPPEKQLSDEKVAAVEETAQKFLTDVFGAMGMTVTPTLSFDKEWNTLNIDLAGDDMGVLIGKRGQTLDSLQYLCSLVVNRNSEGYIHVKADTENYRERRQETLESLARNIAFKVKRTRRPVALEPMNPYERRIIHSALQNDRYVTTHSEGEEPYRKVVVTLKKD